MRFAEQISCLHILEEAIEAGQQGSDCRPILESLADCSRFQDSENPLEQATSVMEKRLMHTLNFVLAARKNERGDIR